MAQPAMVNMKKLPAFLNACSTSTFLKIYHHSNDIMLKHLVLLTIALITSSYVITKRVLPNCFLRGLGCISLAVLPLKGQE